jgi:hypothetical protein
MGGHLLLKRIEANFSQPEVAVKVEVSERAVCDELRVVTFG